MSNPPRPNFFVIGAAKCGTTSVCDLLAAHPDVFMSDPKEPHYYSRLAMYHKRRPWYNSLFDGASGHAAVGEGSTSYSHPHRIEFVVPRLRKEHPDARFIYMVRHPIRRLESDWKMRLREDRAPESIAEAVDRNASLVTFGLYWKHLSLYRDAFSDDQLLVVFLEDLADQPHRELSKIYRHVGVDSNYVPEDPDRERNAAKQYREYGVVASLLRRLPGLSAVKDRTPDWAVSLVRRGVTDRFRAAPDWEPSALELVRGYFSEDARELLKWCGKPLDFWTFEHERQPTEQQERSRDS